MFVPAAYRVVAFAFMRGRSPAKEEANVDWGRVQARACSACRGRPTHAAAPSTLDLAVRARAPGASSGAGRRG